MAVRTRGIKNSSKNSLKRALGVLYPGRARFRLGPSIALLLLGLFSLPETASADPETWFNPAHTFTGAASSGFGSAVSCSSEVAGLGHSYFAVGAPQEASGEGRVHIYGPSGLIQTLAAPMPDNTGNFGYAVAYVKDINNDSIDELAVGEPNSGGAGGIVHMFLSTGGLEVPYVHCGTRSGDDGFGSFILPMSDQVFSGVRIVVSHAWSAEISSWVVTEVGGMCMFGLSADYTSSGPEGIQSRYGQSISEIFTLNDGVELIIGAPGDSDPPGGGGQVYSKLAGGAATFRFGLPGGSEPFGVAVASQAASSKFAFNAPQASGGVNTIYVKERGPTNFTDHCSVSVPMADLAVTAAQSLAHLDSAFDAFVGGGSGIAFGTYRSETSTGGSVGLFGPFVASGCTSVKQVNNCVSDPGQKQGQSLTGGSTCIGSAGRKLLIVGAPGYSNNAGRVDIYAEGTQFTSVAPCGAPTATPTPNPTATPTSTPETSAIVDSTPTATPGVGGTPIPVDQNTRDLPAPEVAVNAKTVTITAATLRSKVKDQQFVGYQFQVSSVSTKATLSILEVGAFGTSSKKRQILSKRNRITLRNLQPGTYTVSYRAVLSSKQKKQILGKSSRSTRFAVR